MNFSASGQRRASKSPQGPNRKSPGEGVSGADNERKATETSNAGYDEAVHGGERGEEHPDVFERLARVDADVDAGIADDLDPEDLVAELEGADAGDVASPALDDLDEVTTEEREWVGSEASGNDGMARSRARLEGDEDGSVSPEELGEQFLRGAVQQDFHTSQNDREADDNVDLLADAPHQVSLFDHNLDPLAEPRFPNVIADETQADAEHTARTGAAAKRGATRKAEDASTTRAQPKR